MKKILFLSDVDKDSIIITYLKPYIVNRGYDIIKNDRPYNSPVFNWSEGKEELLENIEGHYKFNFSGVDIDYKILKNIGYGNTNHIFTVAKEQIEKFGYEKVYFFVRVFFVKNFDISQHESPDKNILEIIYLNVNESFHDTDERILCFLKNNKVISSASFGHSSANLYYEPFLNLLYFYYIYGFDFLSYKYFEVKKDNLIGMYLKKNYKPQRDSLYNEIKTQFSDINTSLLSIYDTTVDKPTYLSNLITIHTPSGWEKNHYATYTDYISSVCAFIFETLNYNNFHGPENSKNRHYITEKTLKAILFSKLNIPFIVDMNPYNFIILNNMGFWFLNTEFFDFNEVNSEFEIQKNYKNSITKSVEYIINSYKESGYDLNKTHEMLKNIYGHKMQNNYNQFIKYLESPKNNDNLIKFILYGN